ncbi:hypothetical protein Tco_0808565 [Tanacetum coccineum]
MTPSLESHDTVASHYLAIFFKVFGVGPDDEASNHEDASNTGAAPKQQQQAIPQTTAISNIKLLILKKKEYDIWAMETGALP